MHAMLINLHIRSYRQYISKGLNNANHANKPASKEVKNNTFLTGLNNANHANKPASKEVKNNTFLTGLNNANH
jgi:hypothetical protein